MTALAHVAYLSHASTHPTPSTTHACRLCDAAATVFHVGSAATAGSIPPPPLPSPTLAFPPAVPSPPPDAEVFLALACALEQHALVALSGGGAGGEGREEGEKGSRKRSRDEAEEGMGLEKVVVWTDGACPRNGKKGAVGGVGVYFGENDPRNVSEPLEGNVHTNNRAEMTAIIRALETVGPNVETEVRTDSMFCLNGITKWMYGWRRKNWRKSSGEPVKNVDLWKRIHELVLSHRNGLVFTHVAAHSGIHGNEMADRLAVQGARRLRHT